MIRICYMLGDLWRMVLQHAKCNSENSLLHHGSCSEWEILILKDEINSEALNVLWIHWAVTLQVLQQAQPQSWLAKYSGTDGALTVADGGGSELAEPYSSWCSWPFCWDNIWLSLPSARTATLAITVVCKMLQAFAIKVILCNWFQNRLLFLV